MDNHISQDHEKQTLNALNCIAEDWCKQFDKKPSIIIDFAITEHGLVTLNGFILDITISEIDAASIFVDVEWFGFSTKDGDSYQVKVDWPFAENSAPRLAHVLHTPAGKITPLHAQA